MKKLKLLATSLALVFGLVGGPVLVATTAGASPASDIQSGVTSIGGGKGGKTDLTSKIKTVVDVLLYVLGAVAVVMIVIGGIRYAVSGGDSSAVKGAKDTILYAVVGLIVAILAYAIVNFVISAFK